MPSMIARNNMEAFCLALQQQGIKYADVSDDSTCVIRVGYGLKNIDDLALFFFFDDSGETMHLGSGSIAHVPLSSYGSALRAVNEANVRFRWINFYIDGDDDIMASSDLILTQNTVGDTCHELLERALSIIDEAYPNFMRAIWASTDDQPTITNMKPLSAPPSAETRQAGDADAAGPAASSGDDGPDAGKGGTGFFGKLFGA